MRKLKFIFSLYFLPVFCFTLAVSPNINGERIGLVLLSVIILLVPATNFVVGTRNSISAAGDIKYTFLDFLSLLMFVGAIYLGWQINWQFNFLQIVYFIFMAGVYQKLHLQGKFHLILGLILGLLLYSVTYTGLNQYGFAQLLNIHNFAVILYCGLLIVPIFYMADDGSKLHSAIKTVSIVLLTESLSFAIFFLVSYKWEYAILFAVALLPSSLVLVNMRRSSRNQQSDATKKFFLLRLVYSISLTAFFIYFFLDSTQVLRAIRGGY